MKTLSGWSGRSVFWYRLISSKVMEMLGFKGYLSTPSPYPYPSIKTRIGTALTLTWTHKTKGKG